MQVDIDLKLDGFFSQWLTDSNTDKITNEIAVTAERLEKGEKVDFDFTLFEQAKKSTRPQQRIPLTSLPNICRGPVLGKIAAKVERPVIDKTAKIPTFYGPSDIISEMQNVRSIIKSTIIKSKDLEEILKNYCALPECFAPKIIKLYGDKSEEFIKFYEKYIAGRDPDERFFRFAAGPDRSCVSPSDIAPFVQSIIETHESLKFLENEPLFQEKFVDFIVARCFYQMDTSLRGVVTLIQFRRYGIASIFLNAYQMPDINETHHIFNYQHFYVAFCKFWDLDCDNDGFISKDDMMKFNDSTLSPLIIDRYFRSSTYPRSTTKRHMIDFPAFCYFLMSSEDKSSLTSINFWYHLCDLDDDGVLSMAEIEQLYDVQFEQIKMTGNETIPFEDIQKQLMDMIAPQNPAFVTLDDLIKSKQADLFFNTLFDIQKFLTREYQFPMVNPGFEEATKGLTPWEIYVLVEYDQLVNDDE